MRTCSTGQLFHLLVQIPTYVGRLVLAARRRSIDLTSMIAAYSNDNRSNAPYVQSDQSRMAAARWLGWDSFPSQPTRTAVLGLNLDNCEILVATSGLER